MVLVRLAAYRVAEVGSRKSTTKSGMPQSKSAFLTTAKKTTKALSVSMELPALASDSANSERRGGCLAGGKERLAISGVLGFDHSKLTARVASVCAANKTVPLCLSEKREAAVPNKKAALALLESEAERWA